MVELEATNSVGSFMHESCSSGDVKRVNNFVAVNVKCIFECRYFKLSTTDRGSCQHSTHPFVEASDAPENDVADCLGNA